MGERAEREETPRLREKTPRPTDSDAMSSPRVSRREALGSLAAVGSLAVAGCSSVPSLGLGSSRVEPVWRHDIEDAAGASPPAVADGRVLVGAQDKALHGVRADDGTPALRFETGGPIEARPAAAERGGPYHVHSTDGDLYAVESDGDLAWHREGIRERGIVERAGPSVVALDPYDEVLRGFDPATGEPRFERAVATNYWLRGLTESLVAVPVPAGGGRTRIVALSPSDGSVRWRTDPRANYPTVVADDGAASADDGVVTTVRSVDDGTALVVTAYEPDDGAVRWRTKIDGERGYGSGLPRLGSQVYLGVQESDGDGDEEAVALDRRTGEVVWRATAGYTVDAVESTADAVFVGSQVDDPDGGMLARLDCFGLDGTRRWKVVTDAPSVADVVAVGDFAVVAGDRELVAVERDSGAVRWHYEPESYSRLGVATADGSLYASYEDEGAVAEFPTT